MADPAERDVDDYSYSFDAVIALGELTDALEELAAELVYLAARNRVGNNGTRIVVEAEDVLFIRRQLELGRMLILPTKGSP